MSLPHMPEKVTVATETLRGNRPFRLLWTSQATSLLGAKIVSIAAPIAVLEATGSAELSGLVVFVAMAPAALLQLHAGAWTDSLDKRAIIVGSAVLRAAVMAVLVVLAWRNGFSFTLLCVVLAIDGLCTVFSGLAERAALPLYVAESAYARAFSVNEVRTRVGTLLGPSLAGLLAGISILLPFVAGLVASAVSGATAARLPRAAPQRADVDAPRKRVDIVGGALWLRANPFFLWVGISVAATNIIGVAFPIAALIRLDGMGASPFQSGLALASLGVGGLVGAAVASRVVDRTSTQVVVIASRWVIGACLLCAALAPSVLLLSLSLPLISVAAATSNVAVNTARTSAVPAPLRARVDGALGLIGGTLAPTGALLAGQLGHLLGPDGGLLALGVLMLAIAAGVTALPQIRHGHITRESAPSH